MAVTNIVIVKIWNEHGRNFLQIRKVDDFDVLGSIFDGFQNHLNLYTENIHKTFDYKKKRYNPKFKFIILTLERHTLVWCMT